MNIQDKEMLPFSMDSYAISDIIKELAESQKLGFQSAYVMGDIPEMAMKTAQLYFILSEAFDKLTKVKQ